MATLIRNVTGSEYPLPLAYGGAVLAPGGTAVVADTVQNVAALLGNPSNDLIDLELVPDGQAGAITPTGGDGSVSYVPAAPAQWAATAPATDRAAIDRLAAAVYALRGSAAIP